MSTVRRCSYVAASLFFAGFATLVQAQSPLDRLSLFKRIDADPSKDYSLKETDGPWLILCSTFVGEEGEQQAKDLVLELRREFKMTAFLHGKQFDFSETVAGRGLDMYGKPKQMKHKNYAERREFAVLVGNFPTVDDPAAQQTLERIRHLTPKCLDPKFLEEQNKKSAQALGAWRWVSSKVLSNDPEKKQRGPMGKAFIVTNPMIPDEYYNPKGVDPLVVKMNEPVEHSLLKCPGRYSVKVATFTGTAISMPREVQAVEQGTKQLRSRLEQAAVNAHLLTEALRAKGYEAYEFHDHGASLVAVGSFDSVGSPRNDGKIEMNPQVHEIMKRFGADVSIVNGKAVPGAPKNLVGIPFDVQALPIEVPRPSVSNTYQRTGLSLR